MIPEQLYLTGLGRLAYWGLYLPVSLFVVWKVFGVTHRRWKSRWSLGLVAFVSMGITTAPLWDVYLIGLKANHLCREQGGLHIYRVVEADGFIGGGLNNQLTAHGYRYVESGGTQRRKFRDIVKDGQIVTEQIDQFVSKYRLKTGDNHLVIGKYFERSSDQIVDLQTGEVLGELVVLSVYPGWFDNIVISLTGTGSGFSPWQCGEEPPPGRTANLGLYDLLFATIRPTSSIEGRSKAVEKNDFIPTNSKP